MTKKTWCAYSKIALIMGVITSFVWLGILADAVYIAVSGQNYEYLGLDILTLLVLPLVPFGCFYFSMEFRKRVSSAF